jgi:protocatechuate 3,4-dioxygenase beta subunit|tara:strand:- start:677 stop:889 length:213 start_codon:yes stop_codon:yes gene_type:complete
MAVSAKGQRKLTTQCYIKGEPRNENDFILKRIKDSRARNSLVIPFNKIAGSKVGEVGAQFDIVLGWTPES